MLSQSLNSSIGKLLPTQRRVAVCHMGTNGQRGIEQQNALFCPTCQITRRGNRCTKILLYLLEDILQRGWKLYSILHGETQPMSLSWFVIGVLSDDNHLHLIERTQIKGVEDELARRIAGAGSIFLSHRLGELFEIRLLKLTLQVFLPCGFYLDIHMLYSNFWISCSTSLMVCERPMMLLPRSIRKNSGTFCTL